MTEIFMCPMRSRCAVKSMALHHPSKPFPLAEASDIHNISGFKEIHLYLLTYLKLSPILYTEFFQVITRPYPCLLKMTRERSVHPLALFWKESELKGIITVPFLRFFLDHRARTCFHNSNRDDRSVFEKDLRHPYFSSDDSQCLFHLSNLSPLLSSPRKWGRIKVGGVNYSLISTSIPAARSSFMSASTVC